MQILRHWLLAALMLATLPSAAAAQSVPQDGALAGLVAQFATTKNFRQTEALVVELAATGSPRAAAILEALAAGDLRARKADGAVFIVAGDKSDMALIDPLSGEKIARATSRELKKVRVNNGLRRLIRDKLGTLTLASADPALRLAAAEVLLANPNPNALAAIEAGLARETDEAVAARLRAARAAAILTAEGPIEAKAGAVDEIAALGSRAALGLLTRVRGEAEGELRARIDAAIARTEKQLAMWGMAQNVWYGLSLGSVLLLAAIGLAITFGVMGVINMAHGEMVMLGAYTTFVVQETIRASAPGLLDWSLAIALPLAFLVSGTVGLALERGVIRFLYGRPLETLLATWGVSLILQQAVRSLFGPTNREVANPSWMSGAFEVGQIAITWNRLYIVLFAFGVFAVLLWALNRTQLGLQMRAVTQNRRMASSMGIRTPWVDAATFVLGSGIAGMAGVALSQIDNVSPNLGQSYIIDSFMVVVFGGVGNLWGTLVGAFTLGIVNKFLEPYAGAVLGKILVLVIIILFIQKRPRGLFALKGRAVEA